MKRTEQKVIEFISHFKLIKPGDKLLVAFSGGPDSVFMLHFLYKFRRKYKVDLAAVHFNHLLRGKESDRDEEFAIKFCADYKIPIVSKKINVKSFAEKNKMSLEEAARNLRYDYLESLSRKLNCDKIVTAHNQSDNTETVLLNIFTGTGLNGFAGIPVVRNNIIRPLLSLSKKEIVDYLKNCKIPFRIDSSNLKSEYKRNFLRNKIIPLLKKNINPSIDQSVFRSAKILESTLPEIRKQIEKKSNRYFDYKNDKLTINNKLFEDLEEGIAGDALLKEVRNNFSIDLGYNDYKKLSRLALQHKGKTVQLGDGVEAIKETGFILLKKESAQKRKSTVELLPDSETELFGKTVGIEKCKRTDIRINNKRDVEFVNADKLQGMFILRKWKNGDRFIPLGMNNFKKVSDFLTDSKVSSVDKKNQLVLTNGNNIVWIVGLRIDDRFKINSQTKKIYKLWVQSKRQIKTK